ncbi:helix-turn-helix transcriptional regulator [Bradyrhizobium diazoefficiens]|nr:AraC family transcriptional regulator [Bradyrhizobium diazoefficiens]MBR0965673.1 helix-turn-helix transcriptional regulator [Bradyrhizobium diazoefficiens]MBR0979365.1 helix-turn-helix transcriptional regulator [Bradyrhizobium diazoefficiens]MBR1008557.1 helix-turn-helix transcriptional regulator [Bradyrhizobium diazoefficiens]MBR1014694.1 helix-turn-helix transcriptional regulator [Bradyrhizobium diazoefficiens]MBR1052518.1 helix-turn-helix transcriptional regulator [Bradyrhizobium diazoe
MAILLEGRVDVWGSSTLAQATEQVGFGTCSKIVLVADTLLRSACYDPEADSFRNTLQNHANCCLTVLLVDSAKPCELSTSFGVPATIARPFTIDRLLRRLDDLLRLRGEPNLWCGPLNCHVGRGLAFLACNYRQAPSLEDIAQAVCLSPSRFAHLFRAELGKSPKEYLARLRVEVAKRALLEGNEKLDSIADWLGFCDAPHFSRVFYKYVGLWPGDFRKGSLKPLYAARC